jgi:hypothetical protein
MHHDRPPRGESVTLARELIAAVAADPEALGELAGLLAPLIGAHESRDGAGWLRGAKAIGDYIGCGESRIYALSSAQRIPVKHDGSALIAQRSVLDRWLAEGGGKRS